MKTKVTAILMALLLPMIAYATSANDALAKASAKITSANSITAKFTGSAAGTLTVSGQKFAMVTGGFGVWYNGKDMYTYSKQSGETAITTPTKAELIESNPIEIIKAYKNNFTATKVSETGGKITIKLTPKRKSDNVKSATLVLNTSTWLPVSIDLTFSSNQRMTVNITSITEGNAMAASVFEYPKAKYPGVEIVDLR